LKLIKLSPKQRAITVYNKLNELYPNTGTFLTHKNPFELLIAVILSAQCTDERINKVTPNLFTKFPTPKALATAKLTDIKEAIKSVNFFNNKSENIQKTAAALLEDYKGVVPNTLEKLIKLPGVGRKTANVVLGQAFNVPGITVDTHVKRVSFRLGFTKHTDPEKAEQDLIKLWPKETWINYSSILILHGRNTCKAIKPLCHSCPFFSICPKQGVRLEKL